MLPNYTGGRRRRVVCRGGRTSNWHCRHRRIEGKKMEGDQDRLKEGRKDMRETETREDARSNAASEQVDAGVDNESASARRTAVLHPIYGKCAVFLPPPPRSPASARNDCNTSRALDLGTYMDLQIAARVSAFSLCHCSSGSMGLSGGSLLPINLSRVIFLRVVDYCCSQDSSCGVL